MMGFYPDFFAAFQWKFLFFWGEVMFGFNRLSHMFMVRKYDEWDEDFQLGGYSNT